MSAEPKPEDREATILSGKQLAMDIRAELKTEVEKFVERHNRQPGLALIVANQQRDSFSYVKMKQKAAAKVGMNAIIHDLRKNTSQEEILRAVDSFNQRSDIDGILVQLPLADGVDERTVLNRINRDKDVDGLGDACVADLVLGRPVDLLPCTPAGVITIVDRLLPDFNLSGKKAVVVGRSHLVGSPLAQLLLRRNCTVTVCHSHTTNLEEECRTADLLVAACGKPEFIRGEWLKPGVVVLDVGITYVDDDTQKKGYRILGDVHFESASKVASAITPVPGGVGPMTICTLLTNTFKSAVTRAETEKCNALAGLTGVAGVVSKSKREKRIEHVESSSNSNVLAGLHEASGVLSG